MPLFVPAVNATVTGKLMSGWWDEINESEQWQGRIFYSLCALYAIVASVSLLQFTRIKMRAPEVGWTVQKVFHLMNILANGARAVLFGFHRQVFLLHPKVLTLVLLDLPGLLFFSTFIPLALFWAEIVDQARGLPTYDIGYVEISGAIYFIQVCVWVYFWIAGCYCELIRKMFIADLAFAAAACFLISGDGLLKMLAEIPIEFNGRRKKLHEVGSMTAICFTCFLIKGIVAVLSYFDSNAILIDVLNHPALNLIYYLLVEILPSAFVLYILGKLPPRTISTLYHPIH